MNVWYNNITKFMMSLLLDTIQQVCDIENMYQKMKGSI
jgi:hypothetical protein